MAQVLGAGPAERRPRSASRPIVIGLVNSMPGEAGGYTEQQFRTILAAAVRDQEIELRLFSLDPPPCSEPDRGAIRPRYDDIEMLEAAVPDGLIVTGMSPRAEALADEPCWRKLTEVLDFAMDYAIPAVWSCLAAHAAILYLDGIERRRLRQKLSGLIECTRVEPEHPVVTGLPWRWRVPHSRYNDVPEEALLARGYRIISRSPDAGADIFMKDFNSLFLFCQGHPEYNADTLLREYRRDIRHFLGGERDGYPAVPLRYFSRDVAALLDEFHERALRTRTVDCLADFPFEACISDLSHSWRDLAVGLYGNWLAHVAERAAWRREVRGSDYRAPRLASPIPAPRPRSEPTRNI